MPSMRHPSPGQRTGGAILIISDRQRNLVEKNNLVSLLQQAAALDSILGPGKGAAASSSCSSVPLKAGCALIVLTLKKNCLRLHVGLIPERCEPELCPGQLCVCCLVHLVLAEAGTAFQLYQSAHSLTPSPWAAPGQALPHCRALARLGSHWARPRPAGHSALLGQQEPRT